MVKNSSSSSGQPAQSVRHIMSLLEQKAPSATAEKWDNVGLLVGDPDWKTTGAVISIDLTAESITEAKRLGYRLIINHHPCIFPKGKGLSAVTSQSLSSRLVFEALQNGIAVISCHTNFDVCALEVVQTVSEGLGVKALGRLIDDPTGLLVKLVVFVPATHKEVVRDALMNAGAGHIGNYDSCSFTSSGEGTFRGDESTTPFLGKPGELEKVQEVRLETIFPKGLRKPIIQALEAAHPYDEVAYDLYSIDRAPGGKGLVSGLGYGFWGDLSEPKSFSEVSRSVRTLFQRDAFLITDPVPAQIRRIGFVAGKGASFVNAASAAGCDLFITGEAGYHTALEGSRRGMAVLELGHRESERFFLSTIKQWLMSAGYSTLELNVSTQKFSYPDASTLTACEHP
ncbi:MAG: Nif3-like dinuclear metal center hexameric protein [Methylotenera sp.]|nr:Nif3-like dinuclear metal center hexameric protein [Oligoflexia bacterium]